MASGLRLENFSWHTFSDVDLFLASGSCLGLTGPSGAGKTLFLRAVADLDDHGGHMWLDGVNAASMPAHQWRRQVGMLAAESAWWYDTVGEHFSKLPGTWLERLGFDAAVLTWQVRRLSSGERQRLSLLRLLVNRPRVLLLDEPTANLDHTNTERVEGVLLEFQVEYKPVVIWISHTPDQLRRRCNPIYRIDHRGFAPVDSGWPNETETT